MRKIAIHIERQTEDHQIPVYIRQSFYDICTLQRGYPTASMRDFQSFFGGGVLGYVIEHSGDLIHRLNSGVMTNDSNYASFLAKLKGISLSLNSDYFESDHLDNLRSNSDFLYEHASKNVEKINDLMIKYGAEILRSPTNFFPAFQAECSSKLVAFSCAYSEIPVFNKTHATIRDLCVSLGRQEFNTAKLIVSSLMKSASKKDEFITDSFTFFTNESGRLIQFNDTISEIELRSHTAEKESCVA